MFIFELLDGYVLGDLFCECNSHEGIKLNIIRGKNYS